MRNFFKIGLMAVSISCLYFSCEDPKSDWQVVSPDGNVKLLFFLDADGQLKYKSEYKEFDVIEESVLGLKTRSNSFIKNLEWNGLEEVKESREEYTMKVGKRLKNLNHCMEITLEFINKNKKGKPIQILGRAYNDGIAFRYKLPGEGAVVFEKEFTTFNLKEDGKAWMLTYDTLATWSPAYEEVYSKDIPIGTPAPSSTGWGFPVLFKIPGNWLLISESDLDESYCGTHLASDATGGEYRVQYAWDWENYGYGDVEPSASLPVSTPWRFAIIGTELGDIVESNLVHHLASPAAYEADWVEPGKSSWSWWGDHESGKNFEKLKDFVDFSAEMGWKYSLVDADWHIMEGGTIEELVQYANEKNVGILLWYNSGGPHTKVMNAGPRDLMYDREIRRKEMEKKL